MMKTKRILFLIAVVAFFGNMSISAQNAEKTCPRNIDKAALLEKHCQRIEAKLVLDDATAAKFAPLYREYLTELRACHPQKCKLDKNAPCTDEERLNRIEERFDCRQKMLDTQKKYYKQFKKLLNARQLDILFGRQHCRQSRLDCYRTGRRNAPCNQQYGNYCRPMCNAPCNNNCYNK